MNHLDIVALLFALTFLLSLAGCSEASAVTDARLHAKRGTDVHFDLVHYASLETWQAHAKQVREQILTGCGLNPMPKRTPLKARVFGKIDKGDYTVETVTFQSYPGLYVVGNLYRPKGKGPFPVVLNPHGHGADGRFEDEDLISVPSRGASFARLGMIALCYSMIGYNENTQLTHRFVPTPQQELWGISPGGIQLWNSMRAVDFVSSLPDVDTSRIGCTGESGGGTQTFMLSAVDDRIKVNSPVCMISGSMQGGCVCENAPLARIDSNSVEIGCLMAPRPMFIVAATGDWTKETREREYPTTQAVYKLFGGQSKVGLYYQDAGHNYNKNSREHVYPWFQRWFLGQNVGEVTPEQPHGITNFEELTAWKELPKDALNLDQLTEELVAMHKAQIDGFAIGSKSGLSRYRQTFGPALRRCFAVSVPKLADAITEQDGYTNLRSCVISKIAIGRKGVGDAIPGLFFVPMRGKPGNPIVVVHPKGTLALMKDGKPGELIAALIGQGQAVVAIDCFLSGEADKNDERLKGPFFDSFYRTDAAERVQDIVTALTSLRSFGATKVDLIGLGSSGIECLFARAFEGGSGATVIDAAKFSATDEGFRDRLFVPAIRCTGDVRTAAAMIAPGKLTIYNAGKGFPSDWIKRAYKAAGAAANVTVTEAGLTTDQIVSKL